MKKYKSAAVVGKKEEVPYCVHLKKEVRSEAPQEQERIKQIKSTTEQEEIF